MNETAAVTMPSVTYAMKAKRILSSLGYNCVIKRLSVSSQKGCTHYISVNLEIKSLLMVLDKYNIKYGEVVSGAMET